VAQPGRYRVIGHDGLAWHELQRVSLPGMTEVQAPAKFAKLELLVDRRPDESRP
jgi:hypothetical protein